MRVMSGVVRSSIGYSRYTISGLHPTPIMKLANLAMRQRLATATALAAVFTAGIQAGESKAAVESFTCDVGNPLTPVGTCGGTLGDKTFSGFSFSGFTPRADDSFSVTWDTITDIYQVQLVFEPTIAGAIPSGSSFTYTAAITPAGLAAGNTFAFAAANLTGGTGVIPPLGTITTTVTSPQLVANAVASSIAPPGNPGPVIAFLPNVTSATFTQSVVTTAPSTLSSLGLQFIQQGGQQVPGPLPLLGAATAFAYSRKLRSRISHRQLA